MPFTFHFLNCEEYPSAIVNTVHMRSILATISDHPRQLTMTDSKRQTLLSLVAFLVQEESLLLDILMEEGDVDKDLEEPKKKSRRIYDRPDYRKSLWWTMLEKGECKDPFNRQFMVFRRRFGIPFNLFKVIVERARTWSVNDGISKLGDESKDCIGNTGVPLELKILGALRMSAKGCSFDAIAELSGMSIATMQIFFHQFWAKFSEIFRKEWIIYPTAVAEAADSLEKYRRLDFLGLLAVWTVLIFYGDVVLLNSTVLTLGKKKNDCSI